MKKRGISNLLATVFIIFLVVVATGVAWALIKGNIQTSGEEIKLKVNLMQIVFSIIDESVVITNDQNVSFLVERGDVEKETPTFPIPVLEDVFGFSKVYYIYNESNMTEFQRIRIEINRTGILGHGLSGNLSRLLIYSATMDKNGKIIVADSPSDVYVILSQQRTTEKPECSDGIDNDGDGACDYNGCQEMTADFSCGNNPNHNDETNPKAQCQNEIDDDNDWLVDYSLDTGCTSLQDDGETDENLESRVIMILQVNPSGKGKVVNETGGEYNTTSEFQSGTTIYLEAESLDDAYVFLNWAEAEINLTSNNPIQINITSNRTLTANFILQTHFLVDRCKELNFTNGIYELNSSIITTGTCFTPKADNVTLDGSGFSITGDGSTGYGVYSLGRFNLTVKNLKVYNFLSGFWLDGTSHSSLLNNSIFGNRENGILLSDNSNYNLLYHNSISYGSLGISVGESSHNKITFNNISYNKEGIVLGRQSGMFGYSIQNNLSQNRIYLNRIHGVAEEEYANASYFNDNILAYNNVSGFYLRLTDDNLFKNNYVCFSNISYDFNCFQIGRDNRDDYNIYSTKNNSCDFLTQTPERCDTQIVANLLGMW